MNNTISTRQLSIISIIGFCVSKLYVMPAFIAGISNEGLWISVLLNYIVDFLLLVLVLNLIKITDNKPLFDTNSNFFNKTSMRVLCSLYAIFFILKTIVPICEQKNSIGLTFYDIQPNLFTFAPFFIVAFFIMLKGYRTFARSMEICIVMFFISYAIIFLLSAGHGNYRTLLPLIGQSPNKILNGSLKSLMWFGDPIYILFFMGYIKIENNFNAKIKWSFIIYAILTFLILVVFYAVFSSIAQRQYYAILKMSKYSIILSNIGRFDYFAAFMLAGISALQIALPMLFAVTCLNNCFAFKKKFIAPIIVIVIELAISILIQNEFFGLLNFMSKYMVYFFILMTYIIPVYIYFKTRKRKSAYGV